MQMVIIEMVAVPRERLGQFAAARGGQGCRKQNDRTAQSGQPLQHALDDGGHVGVVGVDFI